MEIRKSPPELDNIVDKYIYDKADELAPFFKKLNFTPNCLTTISFSFGILAIYFYIKQKYVYSAILYLLSYVFDCFDGHFARKYDMVTKFGDFYDHATDILIAVILLWLIVKKYKKFNDWRSYIPFGFIVPLLTTFMYLGCQEKYYGKNESDTLNITRKFCPYDDKNKLFKFMRYIRHFGPSFAIFYIIFLILYSGYVK